MIITTADQTLMKTIRATYGAAIEEACQGSAIPPEFLAALVANESGGNPAAKRFEKGVLCQLWEVMIGRSAAFGSIGRKDIFGWLPSLSFQEVMQLVDGLASSWGLTQIMGYEMIHPDRRIHDLVEPQFNLGHARGMLEDFAKRFNLNPQTDSGQLFHCWNTGRPQGVTYDPVYPQTGLARMDIYRGFLDEPPKAISA